MGRMVDVNDNTQLTPQRDAEIAKELGYSKKVIKMLLNEEDFFKRQNILIDARKGLI